MLQVYGNTYGLRDVKVKEISNCIVKPTFKSKKYQITCSLNHQLFQKFKLIGNGKFNHLLNDGDKIRMQDLCSDTKLKEYKKKLEEE